MCVGEQERERTDAGVALHAEVRDALDDGGARVVDAVEHGLREAPLGSARLAHAGERGCGSIV